METDPKEYRLPILRFLNESGGSAETQQVYDYIEEVFDLSEEDYRPSQAYGKKAEPLFHQRVRVALRDMKSKRHGELVENEKHGVKQIRGVYRITETGRKFLRESEIPTHRLTEKPRMISPTHRFTAVIERCADTGLYVGYVPGFAGAHSQGSTIDELRENLTEVIAMLLEDGEPQLDSEFVGTQSLQVS